jgi:GNAT superfamily N-acetyltransferase
MRAIELSRVFQASTRGAASGERARLEAAERAAFEDLYRAAPAALMLERGITVERVGNATCFAVRAIPGAIVWNRAVGIGSATPATEAELDEVSRFFRVHGVRGAFAIAPNARPIDLGRWIAERDLVPGYAWAKFSRSAANPPEPSAAHRIEALRPERAGEFARTIRAAFELPEWTERWYGALVGREGWTCYVSYEGEAPAAVGALFAGAGDVAWLGWGATLPAFRRRGHQRALLAHRIVEAGRRGFALLSVETGERADAKPEASYRNILWSGFERTYVRPNFVPRER